MIRSGARLACRGAAASRRPEEAARTQLGVIQVSDVLLCKPDAIRRGGVQILATKASHQFHARQNPEFH